MAMHEVVNCGKEVAIHWGQDGYGVVEADKLGYAFVFGDMPMYFACNGALFKFVNSKYVKIDDETIYEYEAQDGIYPSTLLVTHYPVHYAMDVYEGN